MNEVAEGRCYRGADGGFYPNKAASKMHGDRHMLREAFGAMGFELPDDMAIEPAHATALRKALHSFQIRVERAPRGSKKKAA